MVAYDKILYYVLLDLHVLIYTSLQYPTDLSNALSMPFNAIQLSLMFFKDARHNGQWTWRAFRFLQSCWVSTRKLLPFVLALHIPPTHPLRHSLWKRCPHFVRTIVEEESPVSFEGESVSSAFSASTSNSHMQIQHSFVSHFIPMHLLGSASRGSVHNSSGSRSSSFVASLLLFSWLLSFGFVFLCGWARTIRTSCFSKQTPEVYCYCYCS